MFARAIWDKLLECVFKNFEVARVKRGQFQSFQKWLWWFILNIARTKHLVTGQSHQTNKHFVLKLMSFNGEQAITK